MDKVLPSSCNPESVAKAADMLGVTGHVNRVLTEMQSPPPCYESLRTALAPMYQRHVFAALKLFEDAKLITQTLTAVDISHILFKGPFLSLDLYGDPLLRSSSDIDVILVQGKGALDKARKALASIGYAPPDINPAVLEFYENDHFEYPFRAVNRFAVDLHYAPYEGFPKSAFSEAAERAVKTDGEMPGRLRMSNIDTLMLSCAHYWSEAVQQRMKTLVDCAVLFRSRGTFPANWAQMVRAWRMSFHMVVTARAVRNVFNITPAVDDFSSLENDLSGSQKDICERVTKTGPDSLPYGLVQKLYCLQQPLIGRIRSIRKYVWPHPGAVVMRYPELKKAPTLFMRVAFAARRILQALRTR
jgi:hypothetical protein